MLTLVCNHVYSADMTPDVFLQHRELERSTLVQVSSHVFRNHLPQTFTMFKKRSYKTLTQASLPRAVATRFGPDDLQRR